MSETVFHLFGGYEAHVETNESGVSPYILDRIANGGWDTSKVHDVDIHNVYADPTVTPEYATTVLGLAGRVTIMHTEQNPHIV